ncbi:HAMP domain-containing sensor histidine kinase [Siphonobacter sp. SORGH_AS_0500]|uniref:HAMP domain-containing sensor histidine kinase n=1 Tax=Siphonobacter sp. SORGH_AS_0500 TaxID=1864824 RepID=UPI00285918B9|nr:HAMP domain-containing sensor histidine kinase [Siphonobacter sp. SORGH_AS_0500]MDR6196117.1 signal transduction histidine kinase [Siphonobacter sp. SORGH_AS_0500]
MRLRFKLTLQSTLIFALTLAIVFVGTYVIFKQYTTNIFFNKLTDRALIAGFVYFEKDEATKLNYSKQESIYRVPLVDEIVQVYDTTGKLIFVDHGPALAVSEQRVNEIFHKKEVDFYQDGRQCAGIYYQDNQGDFVIISSGINVTGQERLRNLGITMICFFFGGIAINFLLNAWLSKRTFRPFTEVINQVNSITAENLHLRLPQQNGSKEDELQKVIATFNYFLERLEVSVKSQKHFLKHASHELKTPLAALIGELQVNLQEKRTEEEYQHLLVNLLDDAQHLKAIMEGLLTLSGLESNRTFPIHKIQMDDVLWDVLGKIKITHPHSIITVEVVAEQEDTNWLIVEGNEVLLSMVLTNLIENAIKFSKNEPVVIALNYTRHLQISIKDQGIGIIHEDKDRIFDLFYRGTNVNAVTGHGMGLHLTKRILDLHGFHLSYQSVINQGSTFVIDFS